MEREKRLAKNSIILLIGQVIPKLTYFIILPILTAYLTKAEYGTYDLINTLCSLVVPIITLQIQVAAFRYLIEEKDNIKEKKKIITNLFLFLIPDVIILFIGTFFSLFKYSVDVRVLISIYLVLELIYGVFGQITRGLLDTKQYSLAGIANSVINLLLTLILVYYFKLGLIGLLICLCLSVGIPSVILMFKEKMYKYFDVTLKNKAMLKKLLSYSWPMIPLAISMWIINASDRIIITLFLGIEANAVYAVARKIPNIINLVQGSFHTAWVESASLADKDDDSAEYYSKMFDTIVCITSGISMLVSAFSPILFFILIKGNYDEAYKQLPILILSMIFFSLSSFIGGIYTAKKKTKSVGFTTIGAAIINILIDFLLIKKIGIYAASISTLVSYVILTIFRMINVRSFVKIKYNVKKIFLIIILATISCCLLYIDNMIVKIFNIVSSIIVAYGLNLEFIKKIVNKMIRLVKGRNDTIQ